MRNAEYRGALLGRAGVIMLGTVATVLAAAGCGDILDAELPGRIPTELLDDPTVAPTLAASVVADFECAYGNYADGTTLHSDEFLGASGNLAAKNWGTRKIPDTDLNNEQDGCAGFLGSYTPLQTARFQSNDILVRLGGWTDAQAGVPLAPLKARVAAYGAYAHVLLGEGFCEMRFDESTEILTPDAVRAIAEQKFDQALALADAAANQDMRNLVRVGRARVRLDRGNKAGAAADAALVPAGWEWFVTRGADAQTRWNDVFYILTEQGHGSVAPEYRSLTVGGVPDPRVVVAFGPDVGLSGIAFDGTTPLYVVTNKNINRAAQMRLASYVEAQLIRAEALGGAQAVAIINARRAQVNLPPYTGNTDAASITALLLDERHRELFMEGGHRLNDLLRYNIQWKTGLDQNGVAYGTTRCLPLPASERVGAGG